MLTAALFFSALVVSQAPKAKAEAPQAKPSRVPEIPDSKVLYSGPHRRPGKPMGRRGDVLIPSLSRKSDPEEVRAIGLAIAKKEGYTSAAFYSTEEAYKANGSASYLKDHPQALVKGFLGAIGGSLTDPNVTEGVWQSADEMFPEPKPAPQAKMSRGKK